MKFYLHADLDAFFATAEIVRKSPLRGRPLVVGSEAYRERYRGVALTATYEAREYGIRSGMSISECYRRCPTLLYLEPDHSYYQELSKRVMKIFSQHFPRTIQTSVDEAYMVVEGGLDEVKGMAEQIKREVKEETGLILTVGGGISPTIAKICSSLSKPDGLLIAPPGEESDLLWNAPVSVVPGIGPRATENLRKEGVRTIGDLYMLGRGRAFELASEAALRVFAVMEGEAVHAEAFLTGGERKSYSRQKRWFPPEGVRPREEDCVRVWCEVLEGIAHDLVEEMVKDGAIPDHITLSLRWGGGRASRGFKLPAPTWDVKKVVSLSKRIFLREIKRGGVKAVGVRAVSLRLGVGRRVAKNQSRLEDFTTPPGSSVYSPKRFSSQSSSSA